MHIYSRAYANAADLFFVPVYCFSTCDTCGRLVGLRCDTCSRLERLIALIWVHMFEYVCYMYVYMCKCV